MVQDIAWNDSPLELKEMLASMTRTKTFCFVILSHWSHVRSTGLGREHWDLRELMWREKKGKSNKQNKVDGSRFKAPHQPCRGLNSTCHQPVVLSNLVIKHPWLRFVCVLLVVNMLWCSVLQLSTRHCALEERASNQTPSLSSWKVRQQCAITPK